MKLKCKYCGKPTDYCDRTCDECELKIQDGITPGDKEDESSRPTKTKQAT